MFNTYNNQLVTSNDVIFYELFKGKKGKANTISELSFLCGLFGMEITIADSFEIKYEIAYHAHYARKLTQSDRRKAGLELALEAEKDLVTLGKEILSNNYTQQQFVDALKNKTVNEIQLMSRNFYRSVLYVELSTKHAERFYNHIIEKD